MRNLRPVRQCSTPPPPPPPRAHPSAPLPRATSDSGAGASVRRGARVRHQAGLRAHYLAPLLVTRSRRAERSARSEPQWQACQQLPSSRSSAVRRHRRRMRAGQSRQECRGLVLLGNGPMSPTQNASGSSPCYRRPSRPPRWCRPGMSPSCAPPHRLSTRAKRRRSASTNTPSYVLPRPSAVCHQASA